MTTINSVNTTLSGQSGTGSFAGTTSPTFVTPALGTPSSGVLTNCTGYAGNVTTTNTVSNVNYFVPLVTSSSTSNQALLISSPLTLNPGSGASAMILNQSSASFTLEGDGDKNFSLLGQGSGQPTQAIYSMRNDSASAMYLNTQNSIPLRLGVSTGSSTASTVNNINIASTGVVTFSNNINAPAALITKVNGTEAANAVTTNGNCGVITTSSLSTAAAGSYVITWTNSSIASTSVISLSIQGGTNTTQALNFKVVPGSGSATLTIYNLNLVTAFNGTILIGYLVS